MTINWNKPLEFYCGVSESWLPARVISSDFRVGRREDNHYLIQIEYPNRSAQQVVNKDGRSEYDGVLRLRNKPVIVDRWQNIYRKYSDREQYTISGCLHHSEKDAKAMVYGDSLCVATIKVTFEDTGA